MTKLRRLQSSNLASPAITPHLGVLVESEARRQPVGTLRLLSGASAIEAVAADLLRQPVPPGGSQWQAVVDDGSHRVAASVRHAADDARRVSIIFVESMLSKLPVPRKFARLQQALSAAGWDLRISTISTHTQKGGGCSFFALSATKYMDRSVAIEALHDSQVSPRPQGDAGPPVNLFQVNPHYLEPGFFKHATSPKVVEAYLADQPRAVANAPVNKRGETLRERVGRHLVTRDGMGSVQNTYSASIEHKKIAMYERALATLGTALDRPAVEGTHDDSGSEEKFITDRFGVNRLLQSLSTGSTVQDVLQKLTLASMRGLDLATWRDVRGATALHLVARHMPSDGGVGRSSGDEFERLARLLVSNGVAVDTRDDYGRTALHEATGEAAHCRVLLELGANALATSIWGTSAIFAAPSAAVIELLVARGVDPNASANDGYTPLQSNARLFNLGCDCLEGLLAAGARMDSDARETICRHVPASRQRSVPAVDAPAQDWMDFLRLERAKHANRGHGRA